MFNSQSSQKAAHTANTKQSWLAETMQNSLFPSLPLRLFLSRQTGHERDASINTVPPSCATLPRPRVQGHTNLLLTLGECPELAWTSAGRRTNKQQQSVVIHTPDSVASSELALLGLVVFPLFIRTFYSLIAPRNVWIPARFKWIWGMQSKSRESRVFSHPHRSSLDTPFGRLWCKHQWKERKLSSRHSFLHYSLTSLQILLVPLSKVTEAKLTKTQLVHFVLAELTLSTFL